MALLLWQPFTNGTNNQGVSATFNTPVTSDMTEHASGKLGKCRYGCEIYHLSEDIIGNQWSIAMWIKSSSWSQYNQILFCKNSTSSDSCQIYYSIIGGNTYNLGINQGSSSASYSYTFATNTWYHLAATYDGTNYAMYLNGALVKSGTHTASKPSSLLNVGVGCRSTTAAGGSPTGQNNTYFNDVRFYDHVISAKEVKLLAQGLVVHYPLNDQYNASNLVYNGYGENGSDGWNGTTISTSDLPTADSNIKATFLGGYTDLFPINPKNTYALQCYMKVNGSSSGYIYPSLFPYDIDGKFIDHHRCGIGFNTSWQATLTQPLKYGDTVLYCSDLSAWSTANNNYYYHVAIFGYKDSKGNVYPDFEYTQDSPAFGTYSDKSKINKTNNTITLNSAYTGADRPAGTKICQATEGGTYYYPWGGLESSNLTSWTLKTTTISFANDSRLKYAHYLRWSTYNTKAYYAGIKITDSTWGTNTIYDASGNQNNGTITGITCSQNSARYKFSSFFYDYTRTLQTPLVLSTPTAITMAVWIKSSSTGRGSYQMPLNINSAAYEFSIDSSGKFRQGFYVNGARKVVTTSSKNVLDGLWHHLAATFDGNNIKRYVDGELIHTESVSGTLTTTSMLYVSTYGTDLTYGNVNMYENDIRVYATALSSDQVKQLYEVGASVANNGTVLAYEFMEG